MYRSRELYRHTRNYNCRIREFVYRGLKHVSLENELISVVVAADKGADITEFLYKPMDVDFLWHSFSDLRAPGLDIPSIPYPGGVFLDYYEGGWQEIFPSINNPGNYKGAPLGIHGEVDTLKWDIAIEKNEPEEITVKLSVRTIRTPYLLVKKLSVKTNDPTLYIEEQVTNESAYPEQFMWGHHPALGPIFLDETCVIEMKEGAKGHVMSPGALKADAVFDWPAAPLEKGGMLDVSRVRPPEDKRYVEYAVSGGGGGYRIFNNGLQLGFGMNWDESIFKYTWIWEPCCANEGYPWYGRNYVLGIEPWSNVPPDLDTVLKNDGGIHIGAGETITARLKAFAFVKNEACHEKQTNT